MLLSDGNTSLLGDSKALQDQRATIPQTKLSQASVTQPCLIFSTMFIFVASGVSQPLLSSQIKYSGLADSTAQMFMVPYFAGMAAVGFLYLCIPSKRWFEYPLHKSCGLALVDITSQILNFTGNNMVGSGVFSIMYASVSIWCAFISWSIGLRKLSFSQWLTIVVVFLGLAVSAIDSVNLGSEIVVGTALVAIGSFLHAVMYVLAEFFSSCGMNSEKIPPHINCATMGIAETIALFTWQCIYTIPHWHEVVEIPMEEEGTTWKQGNTLLLAIAFANCLHSATFFFLLKWIGAVSAAVMKGLQAVLVFVMANFIFCPIHIEQCFDVYKGFSLVIVICGVLAYAVVTSSPSKVSI